MLPIPAVVAVHGGDRFAAWSNDASGAPDGGAMKGFRPPEVPQRGTLRGVPRAQAPIRIRSPRMRLRAGMPANMRGRLPIRVPRPVCNPFGNAARARQGHTLLRPPAIMEGNDLTRAHSPVGGDDPECAPDPMGRNGPVRPVDHRMGRTRRRLPRTRAGTRIDGTFPNGMIAGRPHSLKVECTIPANRVLGSPGPVP